jgi:hypothetical protein
MGGVRGCESDAGGEGLGGKRGAGSGRAERGLRGAQAETVLIRCAGAPPRPLPAPRSLGDPPQHQLQGRLVLRRPPPLRRLWARHPRRRAAARPRGGGQTRQARARKRCRADRHRRRRRPRGGGAAGGAPAPRRARPTRLAKTTSSLTIECPSGGDHGGTRGWSSKSRRGESCRQGGESLVCAFRGGRSARCGARTSGLKTRDSGLGTRDSATGRDLVATAESRWPSAESRCPSPESQAAALRRA